MQLGLFANEPTYEQTIERVRSVYLARFAALSRELQLETRRLQIPAMWSRLAICRESGRYYVNGTPKVCGPNTYVNHDAVCNICYGSWPSNPCTHMLALAALWVGGHPMPRGDYWGRAPLEEERAALRAQRTM